MEKVKLNIEIDKDVYEAIKQQFEEMSKTLGSKMNVKNIDDYIQTILLSCVKSGEQMKKLGSKLNDVFEKLGGLGDVDLGDLDIEAMLNPKTKKVEEKKPVVPTKPSNLKS
ncbi:MAG: hypothetical protein LBT17_00685 [Mycoplasmataceae bacterium]|jgi:uncharacterized protein Yka (UPF0111/DUF47 family)|nr:hypothetical protein [Mycoplasmataceae bacterium]